MLQYCRYCANAIDYNGEGEDFICLAKAPCGNDGAGRMYDAKKARRVNKCKHFEFNELDVFFTSKGERVYKPNKTASRRLQSLVGASQMTWKELEE